MKTDGKVNFVVCIDSQALPKTFLRNFCFVNHKVYLRKCLEVIVSMDGCIFLQRDLAKDLHADDSVDEEDEDDEDGDPGQGLEGLDEGPEEGPDALPLREQLDQPHDAEETEEGN